MGIIVNSISEYKVINIDIRTNTVIIYNKIVSKFKILIIKDKFLVNQN